MTSKKDDLANLSGAYVLDALSTEEAEQFTAYLAENEQARNETTELADTAVMLGLAVEPMTPPPSLKAGIMAQLASTPQLPTEEPPVQQFGPAETKARARWFNTPVKALIGVAAAMVILVGGGVIANSIGDNTFQQQQADQLAAINAADDSQRTVADISTGGTATLVWSADLASSVMIVDGLESLPASQVYELWYIDEAGARPAGTFTVGDDGNTWRVLDGTLNPGDTIGMTIEPAGGSTAPTTDPIVAIESA